MGPTELSRTAMREVAHFYRNSREFVEVSGGELVDIPTAVGDYVYVTRFSSTKAEGFYLLIRAELEAYLDGVKAAVLTRFSSIL